MKRIAITTVMLIITGNTIIMLLENQWFNATALRELQKNLFLGKSNFDVTGIYPQQLLLKKMSIWLISFSSITILLHFITVQRKKIIRNLLIGFYLTGCLANVLIVPHPLWFIITSFAFVVVPFFVVENILASLVKITALQNATNKNSDAVEAKAI